MKTSFAVVVMLALAAPAIAQSATEASTQPSSPAAPTVGVPPPQRSLPTRNVKVEVTITEQSGSTAPVKKVVSLVVADGRSSGVRTVTGVPIYTGANRDLPLNVDATVALASDQRVLLDLRFNYSSVSIMQPELPKGFTPTSEGERGASAPRPSQVNIVETVTALLTPGTPLLVARSADAATDRTVTVEVKADILK